MDTVKGFFIIVIDNEEVDDFVYGVEVFESIDNVEKMLYALGAVSIFCVRSLRKVEDVGMFLKDVKNARDEDSEREFAKFT